MGRCSGRAWAYAAAALLTFPVTSLRPALAQDSDEVIVDPELTGSDTGGASNAPSSALAGDGDDDEVINDPELAGTGRPSATAPAEDYGWGAVLPAKTAAAAAEAAAPEEDEYDPLANTGIGKLEVLGQTAIDLHRESDLEDFYEARLRFGGEVELRLSRKLRLSLGTRLDFMWAAPNQNDGYLKRPVRYYDDRTPLQQRVVNGEARASNQTDDGRFLGPANYNEGALDQDRYEIDIVPLSAYLDMTLADGVHMRVGTQVISLGRMDGYSATDILAVHDLRPQPKIGPAGVKLAQPAIRLDWDINSWATLQVAYVPWFMPSVVRPNRDQYASTALTGFGSRQAFGSGDNVVDPSYQTKAGETSLRYLGPPPDFKNPQAEARLNFRGGTFELALVSGTALEKLPSIYYIPAIDQYLRDPSAQDNLQGTLGAYALNRYPLFDVAYHRYYLIGFDGSFDLSPLQVSFEFGYSPERHLYASNKKGDALPMPNTSQQICNPGTTKLSAEELDTTCKRINNDPRSAKGNLLDKSIRKGVPVVQGTLHVEWLKDDAFVLAAEAYLVQALELPHDRQRDWTGFIKGTGVYAGGLLGGNYSMQEGKYRADLTALVVVGPSFIISPQFEMRIAEGLYANLGAQFFEGPNPGLVPGKAASNLTVGGVFSGYDNVYLGFRWLP